MYKIGCLKAVQEDNSSGFYTVQREENEFAVVFVNSGVAMGHLTRSVLRMDYFSFRSKLVGFTVSPLF